MEPSLFARFLEDQQRLLAELDGQCAMLSRERAFQMRCDDACRRIADAYMQSAPEQRADLRALVQRFTEVSACMRIAPEEIRTKIDGVRFRLALLYESLLDLRPDAQAAIERLDRLCQAAVAAGFDPNTHLREVATVSSNTGHAGYGSMRALLLARVVDRAGTVRCPRCDHRYDEVIPACPHCGEPNPWRPGIHPRSIGSDGEIGSADGKTEIVYYLPTVELLGFFACLVAAVVACLFVIQQITFTFQYEGYHQTRAAWSTKTVIGLLIGFLFWYRPFRRAAKYRNRGLPRISCGQLLFLAGAYVGGTGIAIIFMILFGRALGY